MLIVLIIRVNFNTVREIPTMEFLEKASKSDQDFGKSIKNIFVTSINKV